MHAAIHDHIRRQAMRQRRSGRAAFTLTELMISVVLVLLLVLAVGQVYRVTAETVGRGQAVSDAVRALDAARTSLVIDITGTDGIAHDHLAEGQGMLPLSTEQPFLHIASTRIPAFLRERDALADNDYDPDVDLQGGYTPAQRSQRIRSIDTTNDNVDNFVIPRYILGSRNWRTDTFSFTTRGNFASQTGAASYTNELRSEAAWVHYGHLRLFNGVIGAINNTAGYGFPAEPTTPSSGAFPGGLPNSNNFYASQFGLGRMAVLFVPPQQVTATGPATILDDDGNPVLFSWRNPNAAATSLTPLNPQSNMVRYNPATDQNWFLAIDPNTGQEYFAQNPPTAQRFQFWRSRTDVAGIGISEWRDIVTVASGPDGNPDNWWSQDNLPTGRRGNITFPGTPFRFQGNPFPGRPFDARMMAQRFNYLMGGAVQFIVEYAGDFVSQDPNGNITDATTGDGQIDFTMVDGVRHVRWYGLPRDVTGDGFIAGGTTVPNSIDVRPLRDWMPNGDPRPFERVVPPMRDNYGVDGPVAEETFGYLCVWGPHDFADPHNRPQMLRIVIQAVDPAGRMEEPASIELVFRVPQ